MRRGLVMVGVAIVGVTVGAQAPWIATGVAVGFLAGYVVGAIHATRGEFDPAEDPDVPAHSDPGPEYPEGLRQGRFGRRDEVEVTRFGGRP